MKILLTGATGFIGTNLILKLHHKYDITALIRKNSNHDKIQPYCKIYPYDGNIQNLIGFFKNHYFDGVLHLATLYKPSNTPEDLANILESNIVFGTQILEAIKVNPPRFFINTLTFSQFANSIDYCPASLYDASKQAFFDMIGFYHTQVLTNFFQLLLYNTYGKNDTRPKIFNLWQKNTQDNIALQMSSGRQKIDISHIDDVIAGFEQLIQNINTQNDFDTSVIYTLENFPRYSLKELAHIFETSIQAKLNIIWGARPDRKNEILNPISSTQSKKFQKLPGWEPKITLQEGIIKTFRNTQ